MITTDVTHGTFGWSLDRLRTAQKPSKGAPPYSLYVNRPLGRILAAAAYTAGLRPNQVTMISAAFSLAGIVLLAAAPATWATGLVVAAALVIGYALDSADGQLARLRGGGSLTGEWLDHTIDSIKISVLHVAVLITMVTHLDLPQPWLLVPLVFGACSAVHFFGMILVELLSRVQRVQGLPTGAVAAPSTRTTLMKLPTDYGVLCLSFLVLGAPQLFVITYSLLAVATLGYLILVLPKWFRDVRTLDRMAGAR